MKIIDTNYPNPPACKIGFQRLASSASPLEAKVGSLMLALLEHLESQGEEPTVFGHLMSAKELFLAFKAKGGWHAPIKVTMDFMDRSPLVDGAPVFHYRLSYRPPPPDSKSHPQALELRTHQTKEASDFIVDSVRKYQEPKMEK